RQRRLLRGAVESNGGVVVDCQGDAMFAAFGTAGAGVAAAATAQAAFASEGWPDGTSVRVRMALHTGEPHRTADGYTGIGVVRAARFCAAGQGGQVLRTEPARLLSGADTIDLGAAHLPDMDESEHAHQLVVPGLERSFPPLRRTTATPLETLDEKGSFDERIDRATKEFEQRIQDTIAEGLERTFNWPFRKGHGD